MSLLSILNARNTSMICPRPPATKGNKAFLASGLLGAGMLHFAGRLAEGDGVGGAGTAAGVAEGDVVVWR